ncbi:MAG: phosphoglucosamine mutase [Geminicoccaceae bacterium]|nr:phosphoglucosamine mutase [Geminicoccaceae bacterium]MDW8369817.1 phosphoglucosamine mutase [Geminicoccaceae bacterium]
MRRKLFGTDGIRGTANSEPMTAETALRLGLAAGRRFRRGDHRHRVVIGKDTRLSGYLLEPALTAGFVSAGMDVILTGPMPTPAVAFLTRSLRADLGVMISASHNPFADNGIKLFGPDGFKLSDEIEAEIEQLMDENGGLGRVGPAELGRAQRIEDARGRYLESLKSSFPKGLTLQGVKLVVDCANGAAYHLASDLFWELGAEVVRIGCQPNGLNINAGCGSTDTAALRRAVLDHRADLGLALDGDADRLVLLDERGELVDGDQILAMIAREWAAEGRLARPGIVATVMSNLGLERYLAGLGLGLERTRVGDRYVVEAMRAGGFNVGGEQSGHIVLTDLATTGDGLLAGLQVLAVLVRAGRPLSEVGRVFEPVPQRLRNVRTARPVDLADPTIAAAVAQARDRLDGHGRLLVRPSGTEPVIRVMVEAEDERLLDEVLTTISEAIETRARAVQL